MCKKLIFMSLVLAFAMTVSAQAATIIWVSDNKAPVAGVAMDQGFVELLRDNGYTVDYRGEDGATQFRYWRTLDAGKIDELNAADLIIVSRDSDSGSYASDGTEVTNWNGITTPIILQAAHIYRSSRWIWINTTSTSGTSANMKALITDHPIFDGVALDGNDEVAIVTDTTNVGDGTLAAANNGTYIAVRADSGQDAVWAATWEPGVEFYPGAGQFAGGPRMYLPMGHGGDSLDGQFNLTAEGERVFLNAVAYYTGPKHNATNPDPADGADVPPEGEVEGGVFMLLTFDPGDDAIAHTAYFSANRDDVEGRVENVNLGAPPFPVYMPTSYYVGLDDTNLPAFAQEPLETGITYYWVVDEFNGVETFPGSVWSFTIIPEQAWDPTPTDDDEHVIADPCVDLSWQMGAVDTDGHTVSYDLFYGTDGATVATATTPDAHVTSAMLTIGPLLGDADYYWRVNTLLTDLGPPFATTTVEGDVWHFKTLPIVDIVEEDLVAWWKLDGDIAPAMAFDSSGYGNHGTLQGDPEFVAGQRDNALDCDGDGDYVDCGNSTVFNEITANITVAAWIQVRTFDTTWQAILTKGDNSWRIHRGGTTDTINWAVNGTGASIYGTTNVNDGEWHHVAGVYDGAGKVLYVDGQVEASDTEAGATIPVSGYNVNIGENAQATGRHWSGLIDDARIYRRALSAREIQIMAGFLAATNPDPANLATDVERTPTLSWTPGAFAASVNGNVVYYSEDLSAVINRTAPSATVSDPPFTVPMTLDMGASFYWAVDTVNGVEIWPGDVWTFTTIDWIYVDDMESYTPWTVPGNNIFEAYRDGMGNCSPGNGNDTGSNLTENAAPVFEGDKSMKYDYDNDGMVFNPCTMAQAPRPYKYSKIEAQIATLYSGIGTDWTIQGVKALSLRFYGSALNGVEPMWVQLQDATKGYGAKVTYGDYEDEDPSAIAEESWHEWFIDMADFDVDPTNLVSISIGFGNEDGSGDLGNGTVYFDDFRLYTPRCFPARHSEEMARVDFAPLGAPDCVVNYKELDVMADDWLLTDTLETGELLVRWEFNDAVGTTAADTSGNARHGDVNDVNGVSWVYDTTRGRCLDFAGGDHVLDNDAHTYLNALHGLTIAVWVKNRETTATDQGFIIFADPIGNDDRDMRYDAEGANGGGTPSVIKCGVTTTSAVGQPIQQIESSEGAQTTAWQHLALTWSTGEQLKLYIDGLLDTPTANRPGTYGVTTGATRLIVGKGGKDGAADAGWNGLIDDVQIYNYALSATEIATVKAGGTIPDKSLHYPVLSPAEIHEGEAQGSRVVNFKDYAELMDSWLLEIKYPQ